MDHKASCDLTSLRPGLSHYSRLLVQRRAMQLVYPIKIRRKRGITGDAASRREAIIKRERRVVETDEERSRRLSTMAQRGLDKRAEETEEPCNSRLSDMAQHGQERRAEETEEQRNRRLAVMGQRGQQRRAEGTDEQRNSRL
ncbi:hypothetical protein AVEN_105940-1 [Araneus ventricosus]|uniref:STPR domain-containing protein n=1 Tax=Araneus ventricosus TaxID=182803 RepID=A0A4Y2DXA1_ARAVE|nr:hypothetical protein AVEN_105940-1 [Araneus ventricosus]